MPPGTAHLHQSGDDVGADDLHRHHRHRRGRWRPHPGNGAGTSLREAINAANANPAPDTITFSDGTGSTTDFQTTAQTITLTIGQLQITDALDIQGPAAGLLTIDGNNAFRCLFVSETAMDSRISGLTLANGSAADGAGLQNEGFGLVVENCVISACSATGSGGALDNLGDIFLLDSRLTGNSANTGGGISTGMESGLILERCTLDATRLHRRRHLRRAIRLLRPDELHHLRQHRHRYRRQDQQRRIDRFAGQLHRREQRRPAGQPGGLSQPANGDMNLINTIATQNGATNNVGITDDGNKLLDRRSRAQQLADNGGATPTHDLLFGTPALDAGNNAFASDFPTDQRGAGFDRIFNGTTDIGSFEAQAPLV